MKIWNGIILFLLISTITILTFSGTSIAQNYETVTTITGSNPQTTNYFYIPSGEWRISWSYTPSSSGGTYAVFSVFTYPKGESAIYVDFLMKNGANDTSGITYIHQGNKEYYMKIGSANIDSYTIKIEAQQEITPSPTVPEFPITALLTVVIAIVSIASVLALRNRATSCTLNV